MRQDLLTDLAELFSIEAFEAEMRGDHAEATRLYDIEDALLERRNGNLEQNR